ncbi:MAG: hypothetical protein DRN04_10515, partial [Thermoprotei archaeon]
IQYVPEGVSKYHGKVNATELVEKLEITYDMDEAKEIVKALAYITNHYLPALQLHEKKFYNNVNIKHIDCAVGWAVYMDYKPIQIEQGNNPGFVYGFLMCSGLWRAPTPKPAVPAGLYETVNATYKTVTTISSELKTIKDQLSALAGQVGTLTAVAAIEGIIIIILAVAVVMVSRKKAPET